jgi:hypothetical protein
VPKFNATIAADVRAYACVTVDAEDEEAAHDRFKAIAAALARGEKTPETATTVFDPDFDTLAEYEYLEDCGIDTER